MYGFYELIHVDKRGVNEFANKWNVKKIGCKGNVVPLHKRIEKLYYILQ